MTHTVTIKETSVFGNKVIKIASVDVTSYTTGGEVLTATSLGLNSISACHVLGVEEAATQMVIPEVGTTGDYESTILVHLFAVNLDGANAETTAAIDIGTVRVLVIGHR